MTPAELLRAVEEARSGSKRARVVVREHSISSFDAFCLPFRCITRCETIEELSVDYGVGYFSSPFIILTRPRQAHMARLVHNAVLMVACLWAPNHLHWPSDPLSRAGMNPQLAEALRIDEGEDIFVFLADCTEIIAQGSSHLILHSYTYSFNLEHVHSLKLLLVCSTLGLILWRAALYGGSTAEITPLESFITSIEFRLLTERHHSRRLHIVGMTDRGFSPT